MIVDTGTGTIELGETEATPTISMVDYSRRVTDDFGVTTVVERGFSRRLSVRLAVETDAVGQLQRDMAELRASTATWIADEDSEWLSVEGYFKDFEIDFAVPPLSFCTLTVEGLAETEVVADPGTDPAPPGQASTLSVLQPVTIDDTVLTSSTVAETEYAAWSAATTYAVGNRVIKAHRVYEALKANTGIDPETSVSAWLSVGPSNRWAMFDQALGTMTSATGSIVVVLTGAIGGMALLDVAASTVRVQATGYDQTHPVVNGSAIFAGIAASPVTVTIAGSGTVSVGTLVAGTLRTLGVTEAAPSAGIIDYSRKEFDEFGDPVVVERAWAKRMSANSLIHTDAIDVVANRIATVRAKPSLWIADSEYDSLIVYGFFKDFSIERGEGVSKLSLSIEGLSTAVDLTSTTDFTGIITERYPNPPPADPPIGSLFFDAENHAYRWEGSTWLFNGEPVTFMGAPVTMPGWVSVRDLTLEQVVDQLQTVDDDGVLTIDEKIRIVIPRSRELENFYGSVLAQANALGLAIPTVTAARAAWLFLRDSLVPAWNDTTLPSPIVRDDWDSVLGDYEEALQTAQATIQIATSVTIVPPAAQTVLIDGSGVPVSGEYPRDLSAIVKRGAVAIDLDDDVSYAITLSGDITATVENTDGDPDKGTITVTAGTEGTIALTVTVGDVAFGPYPIAFTASAGTTSVIGANGYRVYPDGYIEQWVTMTAASGESTATFDWPIPFPTACVWASAGTKIDSANSDADGWVQLVTYDTDGGTIQRQYSDSGDGAALTAMILGKGH